jgi:hypothetical protein
VLIDGYVNVYGGKFFVLGESTEAEFGSIGALFFTVLFGVFFDEEWQIGVGFMGVVLVGGRKGIVF